MLEHVSYYYYSYYHYHYYVFKSQTTYGSYCTGTGNIGVSPPIPRCHSFSDIANSQKFATFSQTIIIEDDVLANSSHTNIGNTSAHEAGHQADGIYGDSLYGPPSVDAWACNAVPLSVAS